MGTVLVVEDEQASRELIDTILAEAGYQVLSAGNGRDLLKVAGQHDRQIDILLTDAIMPDMNGPQLVEALNVSGREVTALYMSGNDGNLIWTKDRRGPSVLVETFHARCPLLQDQ
jgi:two-component system, cell cycle sensor histidine kinase and response regulator CckA